MNPSALLPRHLLAFALAAFIALPQAVFAQPAAKPQPVAISEQKVELLFVQNATGIVYDQAKGTLRMKNIGRPSRIRCVMNRTRRNVSKKLPSTAKCGCRLASMTCSR